MYLYIFYICTVKGNGTSVDMIKDFKRHKNVISTPVSSLHAMTAEELIPPKLNEINEQDSTVALKKQSRGSEKGILICHFRCNFWAFNSLLGQCLL